MTNITILGLPHPAYRQGMVAGANAAGGYNTYEGALGTFVTVIGDIEVAASNIILKWLIALWLQKIMMF